MPRWFNTTGPCRPEIHYMLPPTARLPKLQQVIEQQNYFVIHAPRQTGKTTAMLALAKEIVEELVPDRQETITPEHLRIAKETLIRRKDTHLDSLTEKLNETRVRKILEPMLSGQDIEQTSNDDRDYLVDLGLLRRRDDGGLVVANPIYREILPRVLAQGPQDSLPTIAPTWLTVDGKIDLEILE